jgi:hypothetical protein
MNCCILVNIVDHYFHFLPSSYAFVTLITPFIENSCRLPILKALDPFFYVCPLGKVLDDDRGPKVSRQ